METYEVTQLLVLLLVTVRSQVAGASCSGKPTTSMDSWELFFGVSIHPPRSSRSGTRYSAPTFICMPIGFVARIQVVPR